MTWTNTGTLSELAADLSRVIAAEGRGVWTVDASALSISPDGRLRVGTHAWPLEPEGLRALLGHFPDAFPRGFGTLSKLSGRVLAEVWEDLFDPPPGARLRLFWRASGVWTVAPATFPPYGVDAFLRDLAAALPGVRGAAVYTPDPSTLELWVRDVCITLDETYDGDALRVERDGKDPMPSLRPRRRSNENGTANTTFADAVVTKLRFCHPDIGGAS